MTILSRSRQSGFTYWQWQKALFLALQGNRVLMCRRDGNNIWVTATERDLIAVGWLLWS